MAKRAQMPRSTPKTAPARGARKRTANPAVLMLLVVVAVVAVIIGVVLLQKQVAEEPLQISGRVGEGTSWGPQTAKVSIIDYSDFGCSHCRNFALNQGRAVACRV